MTAGKTRCLLVVLLHAGLTLPRESLIRSSCRFYTLAEAKVLIERWREEYNTFRPHSALGYRPTAPEDPARPYRASSQRM